MTIEAEFMRRVEADEVTLGEYLERINADSAAWAAEEPGRAAPPLITDPAHWARYKITKASELAVYLDECSRENRR